jgi:hypothetical protein
LGYVFDLALPLTTKMHEVAKSFCYWLSFCDDFDNGGHVPALALRCSDLGRNMTFNLRPRSTQALRRLKNGTFLSHRIFGGRLSGSISHSRSGFYFITSLGGLFL